MQAPVALAAAQVHRLAAQVAVAAQVVAALQAEQPRAVALAPAPQAEDLTPMLETQAPMVARSAQPVATRAVHKRVPMVAVPMVASAHFQLALVAMPMAEATRLTEVPVLAVAAAPLAARAVQQAAPAVRIPAAVRRRLARVVAAQVALVQPVQPVQPVQQAPTQQQLVLRAARPPAVLRAQVLPQAVVQAALVRQQEVALRAQVLPQAVVRVARVLQQAVVCQAVVLQPLAAQAARVLQQAAVQVVLAQPHPAVQVVLAQPHPAVQVVLALSAQQAPALAAMVLSAQRVVMVGPAVPHKTPAVRVAMVPLEAAEMPPTIAPPARQTLVMAARAAPVVLALAVTAALVAR